MKNKASKSDPRKTRKASRGGPKPPGTPHGGLLVQRLVTGREAESVRRHSGRLPSLLLNPRQASDLELISCGGFSPLTGFMGEADYRSVLKQMKIESGLLWSLPILLDVPKAFFEKTKPNTAIALAVPQGARTIGVMAVREKFVRNREAEAAAVFSTTDPAHPGVKALLDSSEYVLAGPVTLFEPVPHDDFQPQRLAPAQTREIFREKGWNTIVAFQTRNPIHRAHEYLQKCALEVVDGLLLHPIVGETKSDDVPAEVRMRCYEVLLEKYYPAQRVLLAVNPAYMRYGGPREAVFHALVRKNFGCTHFIVGRDHAGVGKFYGPFDAQHLLRSLPPEDLGIQPLYFDATFYCRICGNCASEKTCPHDESARLNLSGTRVRQMLAAGENLPVEFSRPEVAEILREAYRAADAGA
ncbi:MAG: sulfate adenylyltransferase [Nitrospirae bacterium]|nr:sulfate adenylyltransferase [Nitrospirota bacterium]